MGQNQFILGHQYFTFPRAREWAKWASERTSERSGGRERSEQSGASEWVSGASERANGRASGPVLTSRFLFVPDHSALIAPHSHILAISSDSKSISSRFISWQIFFTSQRNWIYFFTKLRRKLYPPLFWFSTFRCVFATLWKGVSVRLSVRMSVHSH